MKAKEFRISSFVFILMAVVLFSLSSCGDSPASSKGDDLLKPGEPGLVVEYFNDKTFTNKVSTGSMPNIDIEWRIWIGNEYPVPEITNHEQYSIRWTGLITVPETGVYTIFSRHDDGADIWINDTLVINEITGAHFTEEFSGTISLVGGNTYPFKAELVNVAGEADIRLYWKYGNMGDKEIIPASAFSH